MKKSIISKFALTGAASITAMAISIAAAQAQAMEFDIEAQPLSAALLEFNEQAGVIVMVSGDLVDGKTSPAVKGSMEPEDALDKILSGSGLKAADAPNGAYTITLASASLGEVASEARPFRVAALAQEEGVATVTPDDEEDDGEDEREDVIVVTGTNIQGSAPVGSPVLQFSREDIELTGATSLQTFFETIPQNFGGGVSELRSGPLNGTSVSTESGTAINLRGLGNGSTLVLLNGNRLAASSTGTYVDTSMIPLSAVERIEILTDGASAIYGSDAISGVVNIILREDFDGAETRLSYGTVTEGGQRDYRASQSFGKQWDSGRGLVSFDYRDSSELLTEEREFTADGLDPSTLLPAQESYSFLGSISQDLTDDLTFSFDGLYTDRESSNQLEIGFGLGQQEASGDTQQMVLTAGLNAKLPNSWIGDLTASYSQADRFNESEIPGLSFARESNGESGLFSADLVLSGPLFQLPAGQVQVALGAQYREEEQFSETITTRGGVTGAPSVFEADRNVYALYGEATVPLISDKNQTDFAKELTLSLAGRFEDYSDFGSTFDPKLGIAYVPTDGLVLRASYSTSFRAPLLTQLDDSNFSAEGYNNPDFRDPLSPDGFSPFIVLFGGNAGLTEETSENWTIGADYEPEFLPGLSLNLTYFDLAFSNRIQRPIVGSTGAVILVDPIYAPFVNRQPSLAEVQNIFDSPGFRNFGINAPEDVVAIGDNRIQNIANTDLSGLDFGFAYDIDNSWGQIVFQTSGLYYFDFENQLLAGSEVNDVLNTVFNPIDLELRSTLSFNKGGFGGAIAFSYADSYTNTISNPEAKIDSWETFDAQLSYETGSGNTSGLMDDLRFAISVRNIFDNDPPFADVRGDLNFDGANATPLGRFVSFEIVKVW